MITISYSEFRSNLKKYLVELEGNEETLVVKRRSKKGVVLIPLKEYNSISETLHLLGSKANAERLYESIQQLNGGK